MSEMPELGSKISLISKADIRYEGRLFTVDPQECTIALANVRSFGTEDRETQYPILPQPTIYDYILFRGSDIKDIRVVNNVTIPNDPAIVQLHLPPQQSQMPPQQGFPQQGFGQLPPNMGGPSQMSQFTGGPFMANSSMNQGMSSSGPTPGSRSTTPSNLARKSPTADMGVQTNQNQSGNKDKSNNKMNNQQRNRDYQPNQRERRDSGKDNQQKENNNYRNFNNFQNNNRQMNNNHRGWNRGNNKQRGGGNIRMRGRSGGPPQGNSWGYRQNNQGKQGGNRPKSTLKFDNDYDFEQANSKFEELRSQIAKLKVSDEVKFPAQVNGEAEKKDDSGNETGAGDTEHDDESGYDKTKSFFDNISCEAVERSKGKTQRTDWRQERKLNSETFGISLTRRGGYMFRGRGGFYNRGPQNYRGGMQNYRGGSSNNYRSIRGNMSGGQNRNSVNPQRNQQNNNNTNNQQQQQQQQPQPAQQTAK